MDLLPLPPAPSEAALRAALEPSDGWREGARDGWRDHAATLAQQLTAGVLADPLPLFDVQRWLGAFPLDTALGEALFGLAEALPRTPDAASQSALLARLPGLSRPWAAALARPLARALLHLAGGQFVYGSTIAVALARARRAAPGSLFSFDLLGEGARTPIDAAHNFARYLDAIDATGRDMRLGAATGRSTCGTRTGTGTLTGTDAHACSGVSIKLSAIDPRYEAAQYRHARAQLLARLHALCMAAMAAGIGLTIDAEESARLPLQLDLFGALAQEAQLAAWPGLGLALQAYQVRALPALEAVLALARQRRARGGAAVAVRLVKGAYWDAEIRRAQQLGLAAYPVYTTKGLTDLSYLACARVLLDHPDLVYPQFATHNPVSAAAVLALAQARSAAAPGRIEFQRLHGMGAPLQRALAQWQPPLPVRVYAPVGSQGQLLAYLVRRLIENGANTAFVRQAAATRQPQPLVTAGLAFLVPAGTGGSAAGSAEHAGALLQPGDLFMPERRNSRGLDLADAATLEQVAAAVARARRHWRAAPLIAGVAEGGTLRVLCSPAQPQQTVGTVAEAAPDQARAAVDAVCAAHADWAATPVPQRAACLDRLADQIEQHHYELMALCVWEAGKTLADAHAEVREAVDFCRYYAAQARTVFGVPLALPGAAGETNLLSWHGRGVFVCISPWNFPLAIFTGQVAAALVAGNTVVAKPAGQTPLAAQRIAELMLAAGLPAAVFALLPGPGAIGQALVADPRIAGVAFTGSGATARQIARTLAARDGVPLPPVPPVPQVPLLPLLPLLPLVPLVPLVPLIAETGGLNAMIVDSTALPEQVVDAVIASAFASAGQRCSSLRMLYLQDEIAPVVIAMLRGAMQTLRVDDPADPATDIGPLIDAAAHATLRDYIAGLRRRWPLIAEAGPLPAQGHFVAPVAFEVDSIADLPGERFGPVLHVARFALAQLDRVIDDINAAGYGLTLGIHTRIDARAEQIRRRARAGNVYVNRSMTGAVVGSQPFGGEGLSGTGPKAGGPHYLLRFATERVFSVNTAAAGGDLRLMSAAAVKNP